VNGNNNIKWDHCIWRPRWKLPESICTIFGKSSTLVCPELGVCNCHHDSATLCCKLNTNEVIGYIWGMSTPLCSPNCRLFPTPMLRLLELKSLWKGSQHPFLESPSEDQGRKKPVGDAPWLESMLKGPVPSVPWYCWWGDRKGTCHNRATYPSPRFSFGRSGDKNQGTHDALSDTSRWCWQATKNRR